MGVSMFPAAPKIKQLSARQHALGLTSLSFSVSHPYWHTQSHTQGMSSNISLTLGLFNRGTTADKEDRDEGEMKNNLFFYILS